MIRSPLCTARRDTDISALLGLDRGAGFDAAEREHPDTLLLITAGQAHTAERDFEASACVRAARNGQWHGRANALSPEHGHDWPVIDEVAQACMKPPTPETSWHVPTLPGPVGSHCTQSAVDLIKQRRSAQAFDGVTTIAASTFYRMLDMTLPRPATPPWDVLGQEPRVHLLLFVHRVDGLAPGLYLFLRNDRIETTLRAELSPEFEWLHVEDCPAHFQLFRLVAADARNASRPLSCHQDIAADGAFSLGMLAEYDAILNEAPWVYRQLFWEAGVLRPGVYLEAEAAGVRGTGMGCYFDDAVHELIGLKNQTFQSLYHFTIGGALTDTRLQTLPAYADLKRSRSSL